MRGRPGSARGPATTGGPCGRRTPPPRAPVVVAAAVTGVLTMVALPFVLGFGADPANDSFLPRDYGRDLLLVALAVWVVAAVWAVVAVRRSRVP